MLSISTSADPINTVCLKYLAMDDREIVVWESGGMV